MDHIVTVKLVNLHEANIKEHQIQMSNKTIPSAKAVLYVL